MFKYHRTCRACGGTKLIQVLDLGIQPLANDFNKMDESHAGLYPLKVMYCERCHLGQLSVVVDPSVLYQNYCYLTSPTKTMLDHFKLIYADIKSEVIDVESVIEIGSNDGTLLKHFKKFGVRCILGIEPADNLAMIANENDVPTLNAFFSFSTVARNTFPLGISPTVILSRHSFCHIDDWHDFVRALELLSGNDTLVCIEAPYAADTLDRVEWDQIYHEHLSFLSIHAMENLLKNSDFHLHSITRYAIHGGSIMVMLRRNSCKDEPHQSVNEFLDAELESITAHKWREMDGKARETMDHLRGQVEEWVKDGKTVCGVGASAKSTVVINASGIGKYLSFITDDTEQKQGRYSPGSNIPILPESELTKRQPDYAIIFAWNWANEIMTKLDDYKKNGGKWVIPIVLDNVDSTPIKA